MTGKMCFVRGYLFRTERERKNLIGSRGHHDDAVLLQIYKTPDSYLSRHILDQFTIFIVERTFYLHLKWQLLTSISKPVRSSRERRRHVDYFLNTNRCRLGMSTIERKSIAIVQHAFLSICTASETCVSRKEDSVSSLEREIVECMDDREMPFQVRRGSHQSQ
jgi:hypothetical protein